MWANGLNKRPVFGRSGVRERNCKFLVNALDPVVGCAKNSTILDVALDLAVVVANAAGLGPFLFTVLLLLFLLNRRGNVRINWARAHNEIGGWCRGLKAV